ncbi:hypothetical protein [Trujillonella humicola]|uniref:hypothetical protein n=1 Tax=Trujillonella humicola TaxID=3383699 RepID=UPI003906153E
MGTAHLRLERHGSFAHLVVDRPVARNAMTPAMYWGIRLAVCRRRSETPGSRGLLIAGTGDVLISGGDLSGTGDGGWTDFGDFLMDVTPSDTLRQAATVPDGAGRAQRHRAQPRRADRPLRRHRDADQPPGPEVREGHLAFKERRGAAWVHSDLGAAGSEAGGGPGREGHRLT